MDDPVIGRMQALVRHWQDSTDQRSIFLSCYTMMTENMTQAISRQEFNDPAWTRRFVARFADYYFDALDIFELQPDQAPRVWQIAYESCLRPGILPIQHLLLGINAHINYDLVLTLEELLRPEWHGISADRRTTRLADYLFVNEIIGRTIDAVQDSVLGPAMPFMRVIDIALGPGDEWFLSRLLSRWRGRVWRDTMILLAMQDEPARAVAVRQVELRALRRAQAIHHPQRLTVLRDIL
jgi:hypothetical protein